MCINKIKCLIIEDEPLTSAVLAAFIDQLDTLSLAGICVNAPDALRFLQQEQVDLIFLNIQMPKLSGIDFLKTLSGYPAIMLTTAYRDYAADGFGSKVLDYLLKPVAFERFLSAINKYHALKEPLLSLPSQLQPPDATDPFIYLRADKKMVKVLLKDIVCIESLRDYVKVKTTSQDIITYQRITYLEEKLPDDKFLRIHRSFIIAMDKIKSFTANSVEVGEEELPIGRQYKETVMQALS
ncbi:LytR/AlgR family response regulator transcription factor [Chitinophaga arvensicola]|uniref:DNA-binding response regulator, LytR/AlgR family n=1 Tax=Chitinophaga arvensicola TaxID=29529 RepID=A0A1I0SB68_9BACT|nr:LytTR family DNA-binding domain-containing protein [Chitinophaga arvensicola]SEW53885.1 DNA-binding response regulator, LytR/AlgR family [Chitinophaga arvensicola]